jgi:hypothetical protein
MHHNPNDNDTAREEAGERLVFQLGDRSLTVNVSIVMSTPVVPGVPPRPKQPGDTALALVLDQERMLLVQYGFEEVMQSTPVVTGSPPVQR